MGKMTRVHVAFLLCAALSLVPAFAQNRTGSHLDNRSARPSVLYLNDTSELDEIENLIQAEKYQAAVALAEAHVKNVSSMTSLDASATTTVLYDALNALCIALTMADRTDEALDTCSEAIAAVPRRWSGWNSRGTTHFVNRNFEAAYDDFARAHELAPDDADIVDTIEWNLRLTRERIDGR